jgi:hypothetical protein
MTNNQGSLFGDGRMTPPSRSSAPDPEHMPLSDRDARMWRTVVPNMTKWLPDEEAEAIRGAFDREMERLEAAESYTAP